MTSFRLPKFFNPYPSRINLHREIASKNALRWACENGLINGRSALEQAQSSHFSALAALAYPEANSADLALINCWIIWLFMFDDQMDACRLGQHTDDCRRVVQRILRLMHPFPSRQDVSFADNAIELAWLDFWGRISEGMSLTMQQRFLEDVRGYLLGTQWEIDKRASHQIPDLLSYIDGRRTTGAVATLFDCIEYTSHSELPPSFCNSALFSAFRNAANDVVTMTNDIFSYDKEIANGEVNNCVVVCQQLLKRPLQEAVEFVNNLQTSRIHLFLRTKNDLDAFFETTALLETERKKVLHYVEGMQDWMRGNLEWSLATRRYHDRNGARLY